MAVTRHVTISCCGAAQRRADLRVLQEEGQGRRVIRVRLPGQGEQQDQEQNQQEEEGEEEGLRQEGQTGSVIRVRLPGQDQTRRVRRP